MNMSLARNQKHCRARKGFSLVELVVVILIIAILAVAVFAGGSAVIKNAQVSRTTSDLHNFSVAVESFMNEHPELANQYDNTGFATLVNKLSGNLSADYHIDPTDINDAPSTNITLANGSANYLGIYKSDKTDAWGNPYYVLFDCGERNTGKSEFYITVVSAGPNARTELGGTIDSDDIYLLVQYSDGNVAAVTYDDGVSTAKDAAGSAASKYAADTPTTTCPVNFK